MNRRLLNADQQAAATAAAQHAALSHAQAVKAGLSESQVHDRMAGGLWLSPTRGVYVMAGSADTWRRRAWVAHLATGGVVSHVTVGAAYGVLPPSPLPHVTVRRGASARCPVAKVHRALITGQDQRRVDGLLVTTPSRLLADMAALLSRSALEELVDNVLCGRLASPESALASLERAGSRRRGSDLLRSVLKVWSLEIEPGSVAEVRLLRLLGELGVTDLVTQHEVYDEAGNFVGRLDLARPARRKGLEYESVRYHGPRQWARDEPRYQRLRALRWDVEGVTKADLVPGETRLAEIVARWEAGRAA